MINKDEKSDLIERINSVEQRNEDNLDVRIERPILRTYSIDVSSPSVDRKAMFYLYKPIRIIEIACIVEGTNPSVTWNVEYSNDTTGFTPLFNSNQTTTSSTTTELYYPQVKKVNSGYWLWIDDVSQGGSVDHFDLTMTYEQ